MHNVEVLTEAIIIRAVNDYRRCLRGKPLEGERGPSKYHKKGLEEFFLSDWFALMTKVNGQELMNKLQEEYELEIRNRKNRKTQRTYAIFRQ